MAEICKTLAFEHSEIKFASTKQGVFEGYASVFDVVDSDGDIILPGAFKSALLDTSRPVAMFFNHRKFELPIGKWLALHEDSKGLYAKGELTPGNVQAEGIKAAIDHGTVGGLSVNFTAEKSNVQLTATGRIFKSIKALREISVVTMPANDQALIENMKSIDGLETVRDVEDWLRDSAGLSRANAQTLIAQVKSAIRRESEGDGIASLLKQIHSFPSIIKGN